MYIYNEIQFEIVSINNKIDLKNVYANAQLLRR